MKNKILNILIFVLFILMIGMGSLIFKNYYSNYKNENEIKKFINETKFKKEETEIVKYKGYEVLGNIKIDKINLTYPILDPLNKKDEAMNVSIIKFYGNSLNKKGNVTLAGHNFYDSTMFAKLHKLSNDDLIEITDNKKNTKKYKVYAIYDVSPNDITCLETIDENICEITLITCTKGNSKRLVVKAKEI